MARIASGPKWRRYSFSNQWKIVLAMVGCIALFVALMVWGGGAHRAGSSRADFVPILGIVLCVPLLLYGAFLKREVFIDAGAGFVAVKRSWLGILSEKTVDLSEVQSIEAYIGKSTRGTIEMPRLGLAVAGRSVPLWLVDFGTKAELSAEAAALGDLIGKPVHMPDSIASS